MLIAIAASMTGQALAVANYVYHERTGNDPRADAAFHDCPLDQKYVDVLSPIAGQAVTIRWKVEFQFDTDRVRLYYTTDGSNPSGAFGVASGTTQVIAGTYDCTFRFSMNGPIWDVARAVIPAQPPGTTVKYIVSSRSEW
jgi:cyclomaltodextrinase / maltogenic alpha-amylase / neopullulanase